MHTRLTEVIACPYRSIAFEVQDLECRLDEWCSEESRPPFLGLSKWDVAGCRQRACSSSINTRSRKGSRSS